MAHSTNLVEKNPSKDIQSVFFATDKMFPSTRHPLSLLISKKDLLSSVAFATAQQDKKMNTIGNRHSMIRQSGGSSLPGSKKMRKKNLKK